MVVTWWVRGMGQFTHRVAELSFLLAHGVILTTAILVFANLLSDLS